VAGSAVLAIKVLTDVRDAQKGLDDAEKSTSKWGSGLNKAAGVAAVGLAAVGGLMLSGAKAAAEDAQGQAILAQAMKNSAGATDDQIASTEDWISKTTQATGVADDQLRPALANLVRATGDVAKSQDAMGLAMDISTATGKDLESVSAAMAKAYGGNTTALGKLVPGIDKATLASKDMTAISAELAGMVGGSTAAAANTAAGQYKIFETQVAETKEGIGAALLPVLQQLTGIMKDVSTWAANNTKTITVLLGAFAAVAAIIITVNAVTKAWTAIQALVRAATMAWTAAQWLLNAALTANPIGLVVLAVVALIAIFALAWKNSQTFRTIVTGAFNAVLDAAQAVWGWIKSNWPLLLAILLGPFGLAVGLIIKNFDTIKGAAESAYNFIKGIFDKIAAAIKKVTGLISKIPKPSIPDLNPFSASAGGGAAVAGPTAFGALTARSFAGGVARAPAAGRATSAGGGTVINISGAIDPEGTARAVQKVLTQHGIRSARLSTLATSQAI
jgi:hypothetical protein